MDPRKIGAFIAAGRKEKGYTQGALAWRYRQSGVSMGNRARFAGHYDVALPQYCP